MVQVLNLSSVRQSSARVRQRNEARRLYILRAAARVFRQRGIAAAGMREIAEEEGISHQRVNQILQMAEQDKEATA